MTCDIIKLETSQRTRWEQCGLLCPLLYGCGWWRRRIEGMTTGRVITSDSEPVICLCGLGAQHDTWRRHIPRCRDCGRHSNINIITTVFRVSGHIITWTWICCLVIRRSYFKFTNKIPRLNSGQHFHLIFNFRRPWWYRITSTGLFLDLDNSTAFCTFRFHPSIGYLDY